MSEGGYPSVYVVDSHGSRPPVPPRLSKRQRSGGVAQTLLFILVSLALCGMVIEACFIYRLSHPESGTSASSSKLTADEDLTPPTETPDPVMLPSKPAAHLTDGQDVFHENQIMAWSMAGYPILNEMGYKNGSILIQKEGFYYVYSKVSFVDKGYFYHSIDQKTDRYMGKSIPLLTSKYSEDSQTNSINRSNKKRSEDSKNMHSNSFLGGVFHLYKGDSIFVKVSDTSKIWRHRSFENIFGIYMI